MENKFDMEAFLKGTPAIDVSGTARTVLCADDVQATYVNVRTGIRFTRTLPRLYEQAVTGKWRTRLEEPTLAKPEPEKRRKSNARRDSFARAAMQCLLNDRTQSGAIKSLTACAVLVADALIAELDK